LLVGRDRRGSLTVSVHHDDLTRGAAHNDG
jgi:hypothetical protein